MRYNSSKGRLSGAFLATAMGLLSSEVIAETSKPSEACAHINISGVLPSSIDVYGNRFAVANIKGEYNLQDPKNPSVCYKYTILPPVNGSFIVNGKTISNDDLSKKGICIPFANAKFKSPTVVFQFPKPGIPADMSPYFKSEAVQADAARAYLSCLINEHNKALSPGDTESPAPTLPALPPPLSIAPEAAPN